MDGVVARLKAERTAREADPRWFDGTVNDGSTQCRYWLADDEGGWCIWKAGHEGQHATHLGDTTGRWFLVGDEVDQF